MSLYVLLVFTWVFFGFPHHQNTHVRCISSQCPWSRYWLRIWSWSPSVAPWLPTAPQGWVKCWDHISLYTVYVTKKYLYLFNLQVSLKPFQGTFLLCWLWRRLWTKVLLLTVIKILSSEHLFWKRVIETEHLFSLFQFGHKHKILKFSKENTLLLPTIEKRTAINHARKQQIISSNLCVP